MYHEGQATDYIDLLVQLENLAVNSHLNPIAVNAGGSNWAVGDLFTINGGTVVGGLNAVGEVLTEAAGVATSVRIYSGGAYTAAPGLAATTTAILPSVGTGLTVDANTLVATGWSTNRSGLVSGGPERELLMQGSGSGSEEIFVALETKRNVGASTFYWELTGCTGFDNGQDVDGQPGSSRGVTLTQDLTTPLNNGTIDYFFVIDPFHCKGVCRSGSSYTNFYFGFVNRYATPDEYPYPLVIIGCSDDDLRATPFNSSFEGLSGMVNPVEHTSAGRGPGAIRQVDGQWYKLSNSYIQSSSKVERSQFERCIWPIGRQLISNAPDARSEFFVELNQNSPAIWFGNTTQDTPTDLCNPTPDSGGDITFLWPTVIYQSDPSIQILGEMIEAYPVSVVGAGIVSEDTITDSNGDVYKCFQNCNKTDSWEFFAMKRTF